MGGGVAVDLELPFDMVCGTFRSWHSFRAQRSTASSPFQRRPQLGCTIEAVGKQTIYQPPHPGVQPTETLVDHVPTPNELHRISHQRSCYLRFLQKDG